MALGIKVGLGQSHIVLDGNPAPLPRKGQSPQLSAHFYGGQATACIKMPLGVEVGLSSGDFVLDGYQLPPSPNRGRSPLPNFRPISIMAKRLGAFKMQLGVEIGLIPRDVVLDGDPAPLRTKGVEPLPQFSAHFYCGQRLDASTCHLV